MRTPDEVLTALILEAGKLHELIGEKMSAHDKIDRIADFGRELYSRGRSDCLQEAMDGKRLLPHELKLIARLLETVANDFVRNQNNDFELPGTQRMRNMLVDMALWNDPRLAGRPDLLADAVPDETVTQDFFLMRYLAHRVREAMEEESG